MIVNQLKHGYGTTEPYPALIFIDKKTYTTIHDKCSNLEELVGYILERNTRKLSHLTLDIIDELNGVIADTLFKQSGYVVLPRNILNPSNEVIGREQKYAKDYVKGVLFWGPSLPVSTDDVKCYEIHPVLSGQQKVFLVVIDEGFLSIVSETREETLSFFLHLLRHLDNQRAEVSAVCREYAGYRLTSSRHDLLKLAVKDHCS